jgi:RND family efflux transporter MFP subunit
MKLKTIVSLSLIIVISIIILLLFKRKADSSKNNARDEFMTFPVNVVQVTSEDVQENLVFTGTINAYNDVTIVSETQGKVTAVFAEIGQYKEAGSIILQIDDELKKANYQLAEVNYNKTKKDLERFNKLYESNSASDQQLEGAQLAFQSAEAQYIIAKRQYNDTKIKTPISGIITSRPVEVGTMASVNMPVANVANISQMKVKLNLSESDAFKVKVGDTVTVTTEVYPDYRYKGKIKSISDKSDDLHTYPTEIIISNDKNFPLKAGMFGRIIFNSRYSGRSIMIPRETLLSGTREAKVFVVDNNVVSTRDLEIGVEVGTKIQVRKGLSEGETIVKAGQNNLKDGYKVTIVK